MTDKLQREMEKQRGLAVDMGKHLKEFAATYDLEDDTERKHLRQVASAYIDEQTRYEYMKLQATSQSTTPAPPYQGGEFLPSQKDKEEFWAGAAA